MDHATVLLLEPDDQIRRLVTSLLQRDGYDVTAKTRGDEAAIAFGIREFDVFIVDVSLRVSVLERGARRGMGFLHFLEQTRPDVLPRVIVTSALAVPQIAQNIPPACVTLQKPFDIDALRSAVAERVQSAEKRSAAGATALH